MSHADGPGDDFHNDDERLAAALAAYDAGLAEGRITWIGSQSESNSPGSTSADDLQRMRRLQDVLHRLDEDRRRDKLQDTAGPDDGPDASKKLGRFEILRELGRGGWGVVFLAWDPELRRKIALKVPRPETLMSREHHRRFIREAQTAAGLDHPGIVPIYESGEIGPIWYIASAYCGGCTLADWLKRNQKPVPVRDAANLILALAEAMHYTHSRGIVHRDLKPSNILLPHAAVSAVDAREVSLREPRITDFGLAKLLEVQSDETRSGLLLGTPAYMAPEQAEGRLREVGPATDVYALGVILYELLTEKNPFVGRTDLDTLRQIGQCEPASPSRLRHNLPRDLEAICLKCLSKSPERRYRAAGELAADLRLFLGGKPTLARPLSAWQSGLKWSRRRPALAGLIAVLILAAVGLSSLGGWHVSQLKSKNVELQAAVEEAEKQRGMAVEGERKARREAYAALMGRASELRKRGQFGLLSELLNRSRPTSGEEDLRDFTWYYLWRQSHNERFLRAHSEVVASVAFSPDGQSCASGGGGGMVNLWDVKTGELRASLKGHETVVLSIDFSPGGQQLVTCGSNHLLGEPAEVKLWDVAKGELLADLAGPLTYARAVCFGPDGRSILIAGSIDNDRTGVIRLYDLETRQAKNLLKASRRYTSLALSDDGRYLAAGCGLPISELQAQEVHGADLIFIWDFVAGEKRVLSSADGHMAASLAFLKNRDTLVSGGYDGTVRLWNLDSGEDSILSRWGEAGNEWIDRLALSPNGQSLVICRNQLNSRSSTMEFWDMDREAPMSPSSKLPYLVYSLSFAPDGQILALGCGDHLLRLRNQNIPREFLSFQAHEGEVWALAFSPDDRTLASGGDDHDIKLWDSSSGKVRATLIGHNSLVSDLEYSPNGRWLATASYDQTVKLWDAHSGELRTTLQGHTQAVRCVEFSPDGRLLASAGKDRVVRLWDLATGNALHQLAGHNNQIRCLAFSPGNQYLVSGSEDGTIKYWDADAGISLKQIQATDQVWSLAFSPDGRLLASGGRDTNITIWNADSGQRLEVLRGHTGGVRSLTFSPNGCTIASASEDRTVRLWHAVTGHELLSFEDQPHELQSVVFSHDGRKLAATLNDGTLRIWDAE